MKVELPRKCLGLFQAYRYKVLYGGRGGAKSWAIARALLILGSRKPLRILCARQIQKSLKESVHQLLKDQIELLGLSSFYESLESEIRGQNGTVFLYTGLQEHTVTSVKSFEGCDICWVEEGQVVPKESWKILTKTIRKAGSEIWISLNPILDTDYTYQHFIVHPPPGALVVLVNYMDNPWFPKELEYERLNDKATMRPDEYENVWLGKPISAVPGAIYADEVTKLIREGRYCFVPYDPRLRVHTIWDMGWNDSMAIILAQGKRSECRIIDYLEFRFKRVDQCAGVLNKMPYNWGWDWIPHDGYDKERKTGTDDYTILSRNGRRVRPEMSNPMSRQTNEEVGIRATRLLFPRLVVNNVRPECNDTGTGTERFMECLRRFARSIPKSTNEPALPIRNEYKHGADALRGLSLVADLFAQDDIEEESNRPVAAPYRSRDAAMGMMG